MLNCKIVFSIKWEEKNIRCIYFRVGSDRNNPATQTESVSVKQAVTDGDRFFIETSVDYPGDSNERTAYLDGEEDGYITKLQEKCAAFGIVTVLIMGPGRAVFPHHKKEKGKIGSGYSASGR